MVTDGQMTVYRDCTPVVDARYEKDEGRSLVATLSEALSEATGTEATELPPLYETVDTEALTMLLENHEAGEARTTVGFEIDQWNVFIRADGRIRVCDGTTPTEVAPVFSGDPS